MSLSNEEVQRIAHLARIELAPGEAEQTRDRLNGIFSLIEEMQAVDTRGVEPMAHAQNLGQRLREDVVTETNQREAFQKLRKENVAQGLYLVPVVIE